MFRPVNRVVWFGAESKATNIIQNKINLIDLNNYILGTSSNKRRGRRQAIVNYHIYVKE
jgi:hypothetical protein